MKNDYDPTQMNVDKTESSNEGQKPVQPVISGRKVKHSKTKISELKSKSLTEAVVELRKQNIVLEIRDISVESVIHPEPGSKTRQLTSRNRFG